MAVSSLLEHNGSNCEDAGRMSSYSDSAARGSYSRWQYQGWRIPTWWNQPRFSGRPEITGRTYRYPDTSDDQYTSMWTKRAPFRAWRGGVSLGALLRQLSYLTERQKSYFVDCLVDELQRTNGFPTKRALYRCVQESKKFRI